METVWKVPALINKLEKHALHMKNVILAYTVLQEYAQLRLWQEKKDALMTGNA
jgi:hypothetical protein